MRHIRLTLLIAAGCVTIACAEQSARLELPVGRAAEIVHEWEAVTSLSSGAHVMVTIDGGRVIDSVFLGADNDGLYLQSSAGHDRLARTSVVSVVQIRSNADRGAKSGLAIGGVLGGAVAIASNMVFWPVLLIDPALFAGIGAAGGALEHRQVVVYERWAGFDGFEGFEGFEGFAGAAVRRPRALLQRSQQ